MAANKEEYGLPGHSNDVDSNMVGAPKGMRTMNKPAEKTKEQNFVKLGLLSANFHPII